MAIHNVAAVGIRVRPDTSDTGDVLHRAVRKLERDKESTIHLPVESGLETARGKNYFGAQLAQDLQVVQDRINRGAAPLKARIVPDTKMLLEDVKLSVERVNRSIKAQKIQIDLPVKMDPKSIAKAIRKGLKNAQDSLDKSDPLLVKVKLQTRGVRKQWEDLKDDLSNDTVDLKVDLDQQSVVRAQLAALSRNRFADIIVRINKASLATATSTLAALSGFNLFSNAGKDFKNFITNIDTVMLKLAKFGGLAASVSSLVLAMTSSLAGIGTGLASLGAFALATPALLAGTAFTIGTFIAAFGGFKDAVGGDMEAMAKLPAAAQAAAQSLQGTYTSIQKPVQEAFWQNMGRSIQDFVLDVLPEMRDGMVGIAGQAGTMAREVLSAFTELGGKGVIGGMFDNLTKGMGESNKAVRPFVGSLIELGRVGSTYLPDLGKYLANAMDTFSMWVKRSEESGKLYTWMDTARKNAKSLGDILSDVKGIFGGLADAAERGGGGNLQTLADTMQNIRSAVEGPAFQDAMSTLFSGAHGAIEEVHTGLKDLLTSIGIIAPALAGVMLSVGSTIGAVGTAVADSITRPAFVNGLTSLFDGIESGVKGFVKYLPAMADGIGELATLVGVVFSNVIPVLGEVFAKLVAALDDLIPSLITLSPILTGIVGNGLSALVSLLPLVTGPLQLLATVFESLGGFAQTALVGLILLYALMKKLGTASAIAAGGVGANAKNTKIATPFKTFVNEAKTVPGAIRTIMRDVRTELNRPLGTPGGVRTPFNKLAQGIGLAQGAVLKGTNGVTNALKGLATGTANAAKNAFTAAGNNLAKGAKDLGTRAGNAFSGAGIATGLRQGLDRAFDKAGISKASGSIADSARSLGRNFSNKVGDALAKGPTTLKPVAWPATVVQKSSEQAVKAMKDTFARNNTLFPATSVRNMFAALAPGAATAAGKAATAIKTGLTKASDAGKSVGTAITNAFKTAGSGISTAATTAGNTAAGALRGLGSVGSTVAGGIGSVFRGTMGALGTGAQAAGNIAGAAVRGIADTAKAAGGSMKRSFSSLFQFIGGGWGLALIGGFALLSSIQADIRKTEQAAANAKDTYKEVADAAIGSGKLIVNSAEAQAKALESISRGGKLDLNVGRADGIFPAGGIGGNPFAGTQAATVQDLLRGAGFSNETVANFMVGVADDGVSAFLNKVKDEADKDRGNSFTRFFNLDGVQDAAQAKYTEAAAILEARAQSLKDFDAKIAEQPARFDFIQAQADNIRRQTGEIVRISNSAGIEVSAAVKQVDGSFRFDSATDNISRFASLVGAGMGGTTEDVEKAQFAAAKYFGEMDLELRAAGKSWSDVTDRQMIASVIRFKLSMGENKNQIMADLTDMKYTNEESADAWKYHWGEVTDVTGRAVQIAGEDVAKLSEKSDGILELSSALSTVANLDAGKIGDAIKATIGPNGGIDLVGMTNFLASSGATAEQIKAVADALSLTSIETGNALNLVASGIGTATNAMSTSVLATYRDALDKLKDSASDAADMATALYDALDKLNGGGRSRADIYANYAEAFNKISTFLDGLKGEVDANGVPTTPTIDLSQLFTDNALVGNINFDGVGIEDKALRDRVITAAKDLSDTFTNLGETGMAKAIEATKRVYDETHSLPAAMDAGKDAVAGMQAELAKLRPPNMSDADWQETLNTFGLDTDTMVRNVLGTMDQTKNGLGTIFTEAIAAVNQGKIEIPLGVVDPGIKQKLIELGAQLSTDSAGAITMHLTGDPVADEAFLAQYQAFILQNGFYVPVTPRVAAPFGESVGNYLQNAVNQVTQGIYMKVGITPFFTGIGNSLSAQITGAFSTLFKADGGIVQFANGGISRFAGGSERHVAQVSRGTYRIWAEPETQGEAYIPLANSKRGRSTEILSQVAQEFGYQLIRNSQNGKGYADGGVNGGGSTQVVETGGPTIHITNMYPQAEPTSRTVQRAGVLAGQIGKL